MNWRPTICAILVAGAATATLADLPNPCDGIIAKTLKVAKVQQERLPAYSVIRQYTLSNKHLKAPVVVRVLWKYKPGVGKQFEVRDWGGATGITRDSLLKVLNDEADSSQLDRDPASVTPDHYNFESAAADANEYKLHLKPKQNTKYLLNGYAYVVRDGAQFKRIQGTTAHRLSFWVGEADITQEFANYGGYWLPSRTQSRADVRLIGSTELTIEAADYKFGAQ